MHSITAPAVIPYFRELFFVEGTPEEIFTDNSKLFSSHEWQKVAEKYTKNNTLHQAPTILNQMVSFKVMSGP